MGVLIRWSFAVTAATMLAAALSSPAYGQDTLPPGESKGTAKGPDESWTSAQTPIDPNMSSKPPAFTLPPTSVATPKKDAAPKDPAAPVVTNDTNTFAGFPSPQDAFSALLPGNFKNTKYKWYGFVRMDAIYDFDPIGSTDSFVTSAIPIPQGRGRNFVMTPRYTRLGFDTATPIEEHDWTVKTRIEMDFFNGNTSGVFGSFPLRLRFAWIDFGPFLVGQAASLFMDYDVFPNVLDYQGPPGMVLVRQPIAAVRYDVSDRLRVAVGVEHPYSDIQWNDGGGFVVNPGTGIITDPYVAKNIQGLPDFTANARYTYEYGHCQVAGILRKLTFQSATEERDDELGYGVNLTGTFHPLAYLEGVPNDAEGREYWHQSRFLGQFACGRGINRYIQDVNGLGLDATFDPVSGFRTIPAYGWFVGYEHWWTKDLISNFVYGESWLDLTDTLPGNTYKSASYAAANIIWLPFERMGVGLEFLYGTRENKDGQKGKACRVQAGIQYRF
jgi:hypothetical protein